MKRTGGAFSSAELGITEKNPPAGSAMDGSVFRAGAYWAHSAFPFVGRNSPVMSFFSISSSLILRSSPPAYPVRLPFAPTTRWHGTMMLMGLCCSYFFEYCPDGSLKYKTYYYDRYCPRKKLRGLQVYFCLVEMVAYRAAAYSYYFRRDSGFPCQSDTC